MRLPGRVAVASERQTSHRASTLSSSHMNMKAAILLLLAAAIAGASSETTNPQANAHEQQRNTNAGTGSSTRATSYQSSRKDTVGRKQQVDLEPTNTDDKRDHFGLDLEKLWQAESLVAQMEAERLLQPIMSVPTRPPTRPPTRNPTRTPTSPDSPTAPPSTKEPSTVTPREPTQQPATRPPSGSVAPTPSDFCLMGRTRAEYLYDQLSLITNPTLLEDPQTPQGLGYQFMIQDPLQPNVCTYPTIDQRYGLAVFFFATTGGSWNNMGSVVDMSSWLGPSVECDWYNVTCDSANIHVMNLDLSNNNLQGSIPNEVSTLFNMMQFVAYNNTLMSTLPVGLANLTMLNVLDLEVNQLTGTLFRDVVLQLTTLDQLLVSNNLFEGSIPDEISQLSSLSALWVGNNRMDGTIPATLGQLTNLTSLLLYGNMFQQPLADAPFPQLTLLTDLQIYANKFGNTIPPSFYDLTGLQVLRMENNEIAGSLSESIGQLTELSDLRYGDTLISPPIPTSIGLLTNLKYLVMSRTFLTGATIPNVFANMQNLIQYDVAGSRVGGPIPDTLFASPVLEELYMDSNELTGTIPGSYANPPRLVDLYLNNNLLSGTVPAISPTQFRQLNEMTLQTNRLTGAMPQSICDLRVNAILDNLYADCQGDPPEIICSFPDCCTQCFESTSNSILTRNLMEASGVNQTQPTSETTSNGNDPPRRRLQKER